MTTPNRYVSGALDLGALKDRATSPAEETAPGEIATFFTVTERNLEEEVLRRSMQVPVVVLIGSERADATAQLRTDLRELAAGQRSFLVGYVDADTTPTIAQALGVQALPTVIAIAGGRPLADFQGGQPKENLTQWLAAITEAVAGKLAGLPTAEKEAEPQDPRLDAALEALNVGDFAAAISLYDEMLAERDDPQIRQARATAILLRRKEEDQPAEFAAADREVIAGEPERAFDRLIEVIRGATGSERDAAKDRLIELFGLFDNSDARVKSARTKLASALY